MEIIIGGYIYITKLHFIHLKNKIKHKYFRQDFDYIIAKTDMGELSFYQDGLVLLKFDGEFSDIEKREKWLKKFILENIEISNSHHSDFLNTLFSKKLSIVIINPKGDIKELYKKANKKFDYEIKSKKIIKTYGEGLITYRDIKLSKSQLDNLIIYQTIFSEFHNTIRLLLTKNQEISDEVELLRKQEELKFKEIPQLIDKLIEKRRFLKIFQKKIMQFDDFILQREHSCPIIKILKDIKLNDFKELIRLSYYLKDELDTTITAIDSTIELTQFRYNENSQKEMNILQVIFAVGTIATIVGLGAMPGAKIFLTMSGSEITGKLISFNMQDLVIWTIISISAGIIVFGILNYVFLYTKKVRIVKLFKNNNLK